MSPLERQWSPPSPRLPPPPPSIPETVVTTTNTMTVGGIGGGGGVSGVGGEFDNVSHHSSETPATIDSSPSISSSTARNKNKKKMAFPYSPGQGHLRGTIKSIFRTSKEDHSRSPSSQQSQSYPHQHLPSNSSLESNPQAGTSSPPPPSPSNRKQGGGAGGRAVTRIGSAVKESISFDTSLLDRAREGVVGLAGTTGSDSLQKAASVDAAAPSIHDRNKHSNKFRIDPEEYIKRASKAEIAYDARVRLNLGEINIRNEELDAATENLSIAAVALAHTFGPYDATVAQAEERLGDVELHRDNKRGVHEHYDKAVMIYREGCTTCKGKRGAINNTERNRRLSSLLLKQARVYVEIRECQSALSKFDGAIELLKLNVEDKKSRRMVEDILIEMGYLALREGYDDTALRNFKDATANITIKSAAEDDRDFPSIYCSMGHIDERRGDFDMALQYHTTALEIKKAQLGTKVHPDVATIMQYIGFVHSSRWAYDDALATLEESIQIQIKTLFDFSEAAATTDKMVQIHRKLGQHEMVLVRYRTLLSNATSEFGGEYHEAIARVYHRLGDACLAIQDKKGAIKYFKKEGKIRMKIGSDERQIFKVLVDIGAAFREEGDIDSAQKYYEEAVHILSTFEFECMEEEEDDYKDGSGGNSDSDNSPPSKKKGNNNPLVGEEEAAIKLKKQLLRCERAVKSQRRATVQSIKSSRRSTVFHKTLHCPLGGAVERRRTTALLSKDDGSERKMSLDLPSLPKFLTREEYEEAVIDMGNVYMTQEYYDRAILCYASAMRFTATNAPKAKRAVKARRNMGSALLRVGRYEEAVRILAKVLRDQETWSSHDCIQVANTVNEMANAHMARGAASSAIPLYQRSLAVKRSMLSPSDEDVLGTMTNLGLAYLHTGSNERALQEFQSVLNVRRDALGDEHVDVAMAWEFVGNALCEGRLYSQSLEAYYTSKSIRTNLLGDEHILVGKSLTKIAVVHLCMRNYMGCHRNCLEALTILYRKGKLKKNHPYMQGLKKVMIQLDKKLSGLEKERSQRSLLTSSASSVGSSTRSIMSGLNLGGGKK